MQLARAGVIAGLAGGCYNYRPLAQTPAPEARVSMALTDQGRAATARSIGPGTERVEGNVLAADDTAYLLAVSSVKPIHGSWMRWNGEQVSMRRDYVTGLYERRLNKGRTALVVGAGAWALLTVMVHFDILGFGSLDIPIIPGGGGDPGDQ